MILKLLKNPFFRFLIVGTCAYFGWVLLYEYIIEPHTKFDEWLIHRIVVRAESLMYLFGTDTAEFQDGAYRNHIGLAGSKGVTIGAPCNGVPLFALFIIFILAFPAKTWYHKIWFIPMGMVLIHLANCLRVIALAAIFDYNPEWLAFNHDYTFTILVYAFVFFLWYLFITKFSGSNTKKNAHTAHT